MTNIGVNYLREHMPQTARVHYAITDSGGSAPNVVQSDATVRHLVRADNLYELDDLIRRVTDVARGAALMTGTRLRVRALGRDANLLPNPPLEEAMHEALVAVGAPKFDEADNAFAARVQRTFPPRSYEDAHLALGLQPTPGKALSVGIDRLVAGEPALMGSTDVGSVSWKIPTVQCHTACFAIGTPFHSWQLVSQGKTAAVGMVTAAEAMA